MQVRREDAGTLRLGWVDRCRTNQGTGTLDDWICQALDCRDCEVDKDGAVWIAGDSMGFWLSQMSCDMLMVRVDKAARSRRRVDP